MTPKQIVAKFADTIKQFEPIDSQTYNTKLMRIREVVALLLLQIPYHEIGGTYNLIGLNRPVTAYTTHCDTEFVKPIRVGHYDATIDDNAMDVVRAHREAVHKVKRANRSTYETVRQETAQFILAVVKDPSVRELRETETFYMDVTPKALLAQLQTG